MSNNPVPERTNQGIGKLAVPPSSFNGPTWAYLVILLMGGEAFGTFGERFTSQSVNQATMVYVSETVERTIAQHSTHRHADAASIADVRSLEAEIESVRKDIRSGDLECHRSIENTNNIIWEACLDGTLNCRTGGNIAPTKTTR